MMEDQTPHNPLFGANIDPSAHDPEGPFLRARIADQNGLHMISVQDHPYNREHLDTWTLLTALARETERVHLVSNVLNTPLRPPAMLAKMAATLDVLSRGRLELGLGAGAYWPGIVAYGSEKRSPGEAVDAFEEVLQIIRGMLATQEGSFNFQGVFHQVRGAKPGPQPAHRIRLWTGAYGERMLRLTGRRADGIFVTSTYVQPQGLKRINRLIDRGAQEANRSPDEIRRGYNLMGVIVLARGDTSLEQPKPGQIVGDIQTWVEEIVKYYQDYRQDTFFFWPIAGDEAMQIEIFAREVVPEVISRVNLKSA
jgi:alkanesulfonate monooxygenase SsuD/methylene tetrahydromethanopterin reductase-like flavin-dependent oxidoreductase (luciferase family)